MKNGQMVFCESRFCIILLIFWQLQKPNRAQEFCQFNGSVFFSHCFGKSAGCLTKYAPDTGDCHFAACGTLRVEHFLASSFSCSQAESTPTHTQTVGRLKSAYFHIDKAARSKSFSNRDSCSCQPMVKGETKL